MGEQVKTPSQAPVKAAANKAIAVIFGVIGIAVLAIVFMMYKPDFAKTETSTTSGYVILFKNLELTEASAVVESLKSQGLKDYKLEDDGRTILIPRKKKNQVALQIAKDGVLPTGGTVGFEIFDKGGQLGATDFDKQVKFSRAISGEMSRSISRIYGVEEARVQVVIPEKQLFSTEKNPVIASVFVKIKESELLSPLQVAGIVSLVASSVEGLKRENVTVVDYYGRVLSSEEYANDYEKLLALIMNQKDESRKGRKDGAITSLSEVNVASAQASSSLSGKPFERGFLDVYKKIENERRDKQEKKLFRTIGVRQGMSSEDLFAAKIRFKEKYEKMLEENVNGIAEQFFPKQAVKVKINVELNNVKISETASPNSLISRITTMILLDENNKEIVLTPEVREALMKSVAAVIGYIKGRDRIDLRWAPMVNVYKKNLFIGALSKDTAVKQGGKKLGNIGATFQEEFLQKKFWDKAPKKTFLSNNYYVLGIIGTLLFLFVLKKLFKKRLPVIPETAGAKSLFEEENNSGFQDLQGPPIEQFREMAKKTPERIAAVLEKWFQEDVKG